MANENPMSDEERAELVAYLDGELPKSAVRALEAKLTTNPRLRTEVETLRKTWELLDHLPKPEPSPVFASRTLDRVSTIRAIPVRGRNRAWSGSDRWKLWGVGWAAAVILAVFIGYEGGQFLSSRTGPSNQGRTKDVQPQLVEDFRVIENQRLYVHADDLDFLRALQDPDLFGEDN
jgi:anti-sigma factor RsiW